MNELLLERIYEAAALPELWPGVLDTLAELAGCRPALLFTTDGVNVTGAVGNQAIQEPLRVFVEEGWMERNPQGARTLARREPRFTNDLDIFTREEIEQDPYYLEFLRPQGMSWGTGTLITGPFDTQIIVSIHRAYEKGPVSRAAVDRLTDLRPHLARSAFISAQLKFEQARAAVQALDALGLPAAALTSAGALRVANALFQDLIPDVVLDRRMRVHMARERADALLEAALRVPLRDAPAGAGLSFPIAGSVDHPPFIAHLVPISGASHDVFSGLAWLLVMVPVSLKGQASTALIEGLFDLTPAEARVATALLDGKTVGEFATASNLSRETIRSHVKALMQKTGTHRQVDLVRLLSVPFGALR
ncbi:MAG: helix-turn-helix transcriptional regulator [Rhizobiales bacterium]|nr:helix-turn-helix transcriptional regulator [Hyphomicrobiales bacterium]